MSVDVLCKDVLSLPWSRRRSREECVHLKTVENKLNLNSFSAVGLSCWMGVMFKSTSCLSRQSFRCHSRSMVVMGKDAAGGRVLRVNIFVSILLCK